MKPRNLLLISLLIALLYQVKSDDTQVVDCTKQADGTRLIDPASCTNYYKCLRGVPIRKACKVGNYFDDVKFECNYAALVDCKRSRNTQIDDDDLAVAISTPNCTTPCPVINPVTCSCGNNNNHNGCWPWPLPYPYPYPCPYPPPPARINCNHTITSSTPTCTSPATPTSAPCPSTECSCSNTPCTCTPTSAPCPSTQCSCSNTPCTCTQTLSPIVDQSHNFTIYINGTYRNDNVFMEHPISKRLYYAVRNGKKRLRKCNKGQIFDLATGFCKPT